jgi:uncharacterized damage-inducible protein DinB
MIKDMLLAEYDHEVGTTRRLLERLPDDRLSWKPHERSMSLGGLATLISRLPGWTENILTAASYDLAAAPPPAPTPGSRSEILAAFDETVKQARALLSRQDAEFLEPWSLVRGGQEMFTMPRIAALRSFVLNHLIHHRGQLSVYLRLNDVAVPAIYGPSADEG